MNRVPTPIALFAYNRPKHLQLALESLSRCSRFRECTLYIYCDGARGEADRAGVEATRQVARHWALRLEAEIVEQPTNRGPDVTIASGVSDLIRAFGQVIVLEDDHVVSRDFLDFMLQALDRYRNDPSVFQICGFMWPVDHPAEPDAFFAPFTIPRGWATWERAWRIFDWNAPGFLEMCADRRARRRFNLDGHFDIAKMLRQGLTAGTPIWDQIWYWCIFRAGGLALFPRRSLVWVGGYDGSGAHCGDVPPPQAPCHAMRKDRLSQPIMLPTTIVVDNQAYRRMKRSIIRVEQSLSPYLLVRLAQHAKNAIYRWLLRVNPTLISSLKRYRRQILQRS